MGQQGHQGRGGGGRDSSACAVSHPDPAVWEQLLARNREGAQAATGEEAPWLLCHGNGRGPVRVGGTGGGEASACQLAGLVFRCKRNFSGKEKLGG